MSLSLAIQTALSGLQANQSALQVTSNNISNVNTPGFTRKTIEFEARRLADVGAGVNVSTISRNVDEFLLHQVREQQGTMARLTARENFFAQIQGIFGTPNSNDTIASGLTTLNNNFKTLALSPESEAARFEAVNEARKLTVQFNQLSETIQALQAEADSYIALEVSQVSMQLQAVADLNVRIAQAIAQNQPDSELRDQRDLALGMIAENLDIRTFEAADGRISIFIGAGRTILSEGTVFTLTHTAAA